MSLMRNAVGVQEPFSLVEAGGTELAVKRTGKGQPVICLHATGHGGRDFADFAAAMATQGCEVICVDWPGQGASPPDATGTPASAAHYAKLLGELVPALGLSSPPILLGNSIGGAAALSLAIQSPTTAKALVLCNPGGLAPLNFVARCAIGAMVWFFKAGERGAGWFGKRFADYYRTILPSAPAHDQRARIVAAGHETAQIMREAWESFRLPEGDLRDAARTLKTPCLFAWAKADRIVALKASAPAIKAIPNAQVQSFEGGHAAFLEDPDAFNRAFLEFISSLDPD